MRETKAVCKFRYLVNKIIISATIGTRSYIIVRYLLSNKITKENSKSIVVISCNDLLPKEAKLLLLSVCEYLHVKPIYINLHIKTPTYCQYTIRSCKNKNKMDNVVKFEQVESTKLEKLINDPAPTSNRIALLSRE